MSIRRPRSVTFHMSRSVQFTFAAAVGVTVGYAVYKWLGGGSGEGESSNVKSKVRKRRKTVPGLLNVGNSCFMSTLLQCFASCPSFVQWLDHFTELTKSDKDHVYMADVLLKILKILTGDTELSGGYFDPSELLQDMGGRGWQISSEEQDAHEFFHAVMTTLLEEYRHHVTNDTRPLEIFEVKELLLKPHLPTLSMKYSETISENTTSIPIPKLNDPPLRGTLACVLKCQECGYQNPIRYDGFDSLSLSLPSGVTWATEINLLDCLRNFMAAELVHDVVCKNCSRLMCQDSAKELESTEKSDSITSDAVLPETALENNNIINPTEKPLIESQVEKSESLQSKGVNEHTVPQESEMVECDRFTKEKLRKTSFPKLNFRGQKENYYSFIRRRIDNVKNVTRNETEYFPVKRSFLRRLCIGKLPDCLCIHLQRLVWTDGTPMKKMNFVKFPEVLDVAPYTNISRIMMLKKSSQNSEFKKSLMQMSPAEMHKMLLMKRQLRSDSLKEGGVSFTPPASLQGGSQTVLKPDTFLNESNLKALYRLTSVIVHVGDWSFMGHFLAYRRSPDVRDGESGWIYTSDTFVRKASAKEVFSCPAYMLFYQRIKT